MLGKASVSANTIGQTLFLLSIIAICVTSKKSLLRLHPLASSPSLSPSPSSSLSSSSSSPILLKTYKVVLLELQQPVNHLLTIDNDGVITKVLKEVEDKLYIYITAPSTTSKVAVCGYISDIYAKVWDEMLQLNKMHLQCFVVGDVPDAGLVSLSQLYALSNIEAVYTFDAKRAIDFKSSRVYGGLSNINIEDIVPLYSVMNDNSVFHVVDDNTDTNIATKSTLNYRKVALGGTFDQLHNGHKKLLTLASVYCTDQLIVGITSDVMLKSKKNFSKIQSFARRKEIIEGFLGEIKPCLKISVVELQDTYGPTITDASIEAIIVSSETVSGAKKINEKRIINNLKPLDILITRRTQAANLSSTFIREKTAQQDGSKKLYNFIKNYFINLFDANANKNVLNNGL